MLTLDQKARKVADKLKTLQDRIKRRDSRASLKKAIVDNRADKIRARDETLVRKQDQRIYRLWQFKYVEAVTPGQIKFREHLRAAIARDTDAVAMAQARIIMDQSD